MKPNILLACKKSSCFPPKNLPEKNCLPTLTLALTLTQTVSPTERQFSSGAICRTPVKIKETKNLKEITRTLNSSSWGKSDDD